MTEFVRAKGYFREMPVITVAEGELWPADDPIVKAHPDWFETLDGEPLRAAKPARSQVPVEQATAAPGERRTTRRSAS